MYFLNDLNFSRRDAGFKARKDALDIASDYENISVVNIPLWGGVVQRLSLIHISEPTRLGMISYAVFCLKKKKKKTYARSNTEEYSP